MDPLVSHIFCPEIRYPSPSGRAAVRMAATSEPSPGSDIDSAPRASPVAIRGRRYSRCSSVPWVAMR